MPKSSTADGKAREAVKSPLSRLLARRLAEEGREPGAPVTVAALCKTLLPYNACRDTLGVASKGEYDVALLRFMRTGGVLSLDRELAKAVDSELANPEPGLAFLRNFAAAKIAVHIRPAGPEPDRADADRELPDDLDDLIGVTSAHSNDEPEEVPDEPSAEAEGTMTASEDAESCPQCDEALPRDREVLFCPFCGQDQSVVLCVQCGEELSGEWRFCPRCGTSAERS